MHALNADVETLPRAKFFTHDEERCSLQHLMAFFFRPEFLDVNLSPRARREFAFVCGGCGLVHWARVWEIATQERCWNCGQLMIVPAPRRSPLIPPAFASPVRAFSLR